MAVRWYSKTDVQWKLVLAAEGAKQWYSERMMTMRRERNLII